MAKRDFYGIRLCEWCGTFLAPWEANVCMDCEEEGAR